MYWHNLSGGLRVMLDRFYGPVASGSLAGKDLYLIYQGAAPEKRLLQASIFQEQRPDKWMLEAGVYTIQRFASLYGLDYKGCISYRQDIAPLKARLHQSIWTSLASLRNRKGIRVQLLISIKLKNLQLSIKFFGWRSNLETEGFYLIQWKTGRIWTL